MMLFLSIKAIIETVKSIKPQNILIQKAARIINFVLKRLD